MTRRGSGEERRWRRSRNLEPGADGSIHGEQPVEPKGRQPREKPEGHRHKQPQPHEDHGAEHDAGGSDPNPHTGSTANPHAVTHSQVGAPTGNPHSVTHAETNPPTTNPHNVTAAQAGAVANSVGSPARRRENRADQPAPGNVAIGTESRIKDEADLLEVAADTTGDGTADTWIQPAASRHGNDRHTDGSVPSLVVGSYVAPQHIIDASDETAGSTDGQVAINAAMEKLPDGTKT